MAMDKRNDLLAQIDKLQGLLRDAIEHHGDSGLDEIVGLVLEIKKQVEGLGHE